MTKINSLIIFVLSILILASCFINPDKQMEYEDKKETAAIIDVILDNGGETVNNVSEIILDLQNSNFRYVTKNIVVMSGDWIYYTTGNSIYKMNNEGTESVKIVDGFFDILNLNIIDSHLYFYGYIIEEIVPRIYSLCLYNEELKEVIDDIHFDFDVVDGYFYANIRNRDDNNNTISASLVKFKPNTNGSVTSDEIILLDEGERGFSFERIVLIDDWIYYFYVHHGDIPEKVEKADFYKIDTNGENKTKLGAYRYPAVISDDWVYTNRGEEGEGIYKININTNESVKLISINNIGGFILKDDWIYYISRYIDYSGKGKHEFNINKIKIDGTINTKLSENQSGWAGNINIIGDWIFYSEAGNFGSINEIFFMQMIDKT